MKRAFIPILYVSLMNASISAQNVTGKVINKSKEPVEYATIILQTPDSAYVNSTYTDSAGSFTLSTEISAYRLIIQHLLYETHEENFGSITFCMGTGRCGTGRCGI